MNGHVWEDGAGSVTVYVSQTMCLELRCGLHSWSLELVFSHFASAAPCAAYSTYYFRLQFARSGSDTGTTTSGRSSEQPPL